MTTLREAAQQALEALERSETTVPYEGFGILQREAIRKHAEAITALRAALYGSKLGDGWFQWHGGDCPVPAGTMVQVRFRRGGDEINRIAEVLEWGHRNLGWWWDIVAYRIVNPANMIPTTEEAWNKAVVMLGDALAEQPAEQSAKHMELVRGEWQGYTWNPYAISQPKAEPLTTEEIYECERIAAIRHHRHKNSIRGQQLTPADDPQWHFANAIIAAYERKNGIGEQP